MTEIEEWRPIEGYEGLYEVSTLGRVRSLERIDNNNHLVKGRILKPTTDKDGYFRVDLHKEGKVKHFLIHRLVAQTFIPNPERLPIINHKDEDKTNNIVFLNPDGSFKESNLEWCTYEYNINYGTRNERVAKNMVQTKIGKGIFDPEMCGIGDEKEYHRLYRQKNLEKIREYQREWARERRRKKQRQTT